MNEGEGEKEGWGERRRGGGGGEEERGRGGERRRGGERGERRRGGRGGRGTVPSCGFLFLNLFNLFEHF